MSQHPTAVQVSALMPSKLCSACDNIFKGRRPAYRQPRPHLSHGHLLASAALGCYICRTIVNSHSWASTYASQHNACFEYDISFNFHQRFTSLSIAEDVRKSNVKWKFRALYERDYNELVDSYTPPRDPLGPALFKLATTWLHECGRTHPLCNPADPAFRPTRLIQIIDSKLARLVIPAETPTGQYVAFSHCWGKKKTLKLGRNNLDQLRKGIQVESLPKSYQEAISICLGLNFHFIWIDSLCIIQDSTEDWQQEALAMKLVYGNAVLNLCSAAAVDNSEESFASRDHTLIRPLEVNTAWCGEDRQAFRLIYSDIFRDDILYSPLRERAWVFQEWYLSTRSLVIARRQLWWHCRQKVTCEALPNGYKDEQTMRDHRPDLQPDWMKDDMGQLDREQESLTLWTRRVNHYVETRLTEESDRLIAFSGIAQAFGSSHGITHDYLAGLWRRHLPTSLCWYVANSRTSRSSRYKAPSWSWASVDGPFELCGGRGYAERDNEDEKLCVSVEDVWLTYADERHITGLVKGGAIKLRGRLLGPKKVVMVSERRLRYFDNAMADEDIIGPYMMFDEGDEEGPLVSYLDSLNTEGRRKGLTEGASRRTEPIKNAQGSVFFLPIEHQSGTMAVQGIILYQPTHQTVVFHRIGYFVSSKLPSGSYSHLLASEYPKKTFLIL